MIPSNVEIDLAFKRHGFPVSVIGDCISIGDRLSWILVKKGPPYSGSYIWASCSKNEDDWEVSLFDYSGRGMTLNDALTDFRIRLVEERNMLNEVLGYDRDIAANG